MLKLPKSLNTQNHQALLLKALNQVSPPLFEGSDDTLPLVQPTESILRVLRHCRRAGQLVGGLEKIVQELSKEDQGFQSLAKRDIQNKPQALTRIVLLGNGGTERFYRTAIRDLSPLAPWVGLLRWDMEPTQCGETFFGSDSPVKALLIAQKEWVNQFLESWLEDFGTNG